MTPIGLPYLALGVRWLSGRFEPRGSRATITRRSREGSRPATVTLGEEATEEENIWTHSVDERSHKDEVGDERVENNLTTGGVPLIGDLVALPPDEDGSRQADVEHLPRGEGRPLMRRAGGGKSRAVRR